MRRIDQHNRQSYGGASDWQRIWHMRVEDSGRVEFDIQKLLARYVVASSYIKDGAEQATRELFRAPLMRVMTAVHDVIGPTFSDGDLWSGYEAYLWE